jgi:hypothetical protein
MHSHRAGLSAGRSLPPVPQTGISSSVTLDEQTSTADLLQLFGCAAEQTWPLWHLPNYLTVIAL